MRKEGTRGVWGLQRENIYIFLQKQGDREVVWQGVVVQSYCRRLSRSCGIKATN